MSTNTNTEGSGSHTNPLDQKSQSSHQQKHGETTLSTLLSNLEITLHEETYVFATVPAQDFFADSPKFPVPLSSILLFFREPTTKGSSSNGSDSGNDNVTLILPLSLTLTQDGAWNPKWPTTYESRMLTCAIHSSLEAVGFMAVLTAALADQKISVNPVSGWFHDHLFVPAQRAEEAVRVLIGVRESARQKERESK